LSHPDPTNPHSRDGRTDHYLENAYNANTSAVQKKLKEKLDAALR
jgi:hypothetical protein